MPCGQSHKHVVERKVNEIDLTTDSKYYLTITLLLRAHNVCVCRACSVKWMVCPTVKGWSDEKCSDEGYI